MWDSLSAASRRVMHSAESEAGHLGHRYVGDEHLLLALADHPDPPVQAVLAGHRLDATALRDAVEDLLRAGQLPVAREDEAELLRSLGVDVEEVRARLDASFGRATVSESMHPRAHRTAARSPWCGRLVLTKRAVTLAIAVADRLGHDSVDPAHLLSGVLRDARDPLGTQLSHRGRAELARVGLRAGADNPVALMLDRRGVDSRILEAEMLASLRTP